MCLIGTENQCGAAELMGRTPVFVFAKNRRRRDFLANGLEHRS
jgi:hypothetical protein